MEFVRTLTLDANGGEISSYTIDLPKPISILDDGAYLQKVDRLSVSPHYDGLWDNGTYDTMVWQGQDITGTFTLTMTMEVTQRLQVWDLDEGTVLNKEDVPQFYLDTYLGDEWRIIVGDPQIEALREDIVGNETNVYLIAKAIYDWIDDNVDYHIWTGTDGPLSSLQTLDVLKGDCDDQSILFCALARSAGVPAWLQLGSVYSPGDDEMGGHAWVQMFMPTEDGGTNVTIDIVNDRFLVWMPTLFCEYTDNGIANDLEGAYHHVYLTYPNNSPAPDVEEGWEMISYEESGEKVVLGTLMTREEF